jgi:ADP-heptose:LPS heptosyltransferase
VKILVLQLARLGDIFQTWPTLHALQRSGAEIHVLVRPRFRAAAEGCDAIKKVHEFETEKILFPILQKPHEGLRPSLEAIDSLLHSLDSEKFDRVINLSFSPLSSWITFDLEMRSFQRGRAIAVAGYTRHIDGALAIPDDASAYFFAQVGYRAQTGAVDAVNRLSLPRLFATIASVDPIEEDWRGPSKIRALRQDLELPIEFIAIHIGASSDDKTLSAQHWGEVAVQVSRRTFLPVVLLGSSDETTKASEILAEVTHQNRSFDGIAARVYSVVGRTSIPDIFEVVRHASILIAGDSALVQVASLIGTQVLNLSSRAVSHWETGPASVGSRILTYGGAAPSTEVIAQEVVSMLRGTMDGSVADRVVQGPIEPTPTHTSDGQLDFMWQLISAIYMGTPVPISGDPRIQDALQQWCEIQNIENLQLTSLRDGVGDARQIGTILDRVDELTHLLIEAEPRLAPIERWWSTEKVRMGPQTQTLLTEKYLALNQQLESVLLSLREIEGQRDGHQLDI